MGGNAFKERETSRLNQADYERLSAKFLDAANQTLASFGSTSKAGIVPSWREKTEHGDIDMVLPEDSLGGKYNHFIKRLAAELGVEGLHHKQNGNMLNCAYMDGDKCIQVDLIFVKDAAFDFALSYLSWNDVSTILLRVASKMGVAVGINGLSLTAKKGAHKVGRVILTRSYEEMCGYLGLNYQRWKMGFNNLEEIYEFFAEWQGFSAKVFCLEKMNNVDRKSVQKRVGYMQFLEWIDTHPEKEKRYDWHKRYQTQFEQIWQAFPAAKAEFEAIFIEIDKKKECNEKFNGNVVSELTGLKFKELGDFMTNFKRRFKSQEDFMAYVLDTDLEQIKADIKAQNE